MPIYEYKCEGCGKKLEKLQSNFNSLSYCDEIDSSCKSHGKLHKLFSQFAFSGESTSQNEGCAMETQSTGGHQHSGGCCGCGMSDSGCMN